MSALIIMACYDTEENGRSEYTERTLMSLKDTVDWTKHRLIVVDNGSCSRTKNLLLQLPMYGFYSYIPNAKVITLPENVGTAKAINEGLRLRNPGEMCVKLDNDCVIHSPGWVDEMEEVIERDPQIGIVGLKRKDVQFDGIYKALPHVSGQRWVTVETGGQIMGTCTMFNWRLVDKIGGMVQCGLYGLDDTLYDLRSQMAGFYNCYLPHINIDHIDTGANIYTQVKQSQVRAIWPQYMALHESYCNGTRPIYEEI